MPGTIPEDVVARIFNVCEEALPQQGRDALAAWVSDVEAGGLLPPSGNANRTADKPRELIDVLKGQLLAQRQEQLLAIIRETPGWGQSEIGKTGYLHVHDTPAGADSTAREQRMALVVGSCGSEAGGDDGLKALESLQSWRERYVVLTPGTLEFYRETTSTEKQSGMEGVGLGRGKKKLTRTIHRKLSDLVRCKPYRPSGGGLSWEAAAEVMQSAAGEEEEAAPPDSEAAAEEELSTGAYFFELVFQNPQDIFVTDSLYLQAASAEQGAEWLRLIGESRNKAVNSTVDQEEDERTQLLLDELEDAFAELSNVLYRWAEGKVLFRPKGLELMDSCCCALVSAYTPPRP